MIATNGAVRNPYALVEIGALRQQIDTLQRRNTDLEIACRAYRRLLGRYDPARVGESDIPTAPPPTPAGPVTITALIPPLLTGSIVRYCRLCDEPLPPEAPPQRLFCADPCRVAFAKARYRVRKGIVT